MNVLVHPCEVYIQRTSINIHPYVLFIPYLICTGKYSLTVGTKAVSSTVWGLEELNNRISPHPQLASIR